MPRNVDPKKSLDATIPGRQKITFTEVSIDTFLTPKRDPSMPPFLVSKTFPSQKRELVH